MGQITITLPDGSKRQYRRGATRREIAESIIKGLAREALSITVNGEVRDLARPVTEDAAVKIGRRDDGPRRDDAERRVNVADRHPVELAALERQIGHEVQRRVLPRGEQPEVNSQSVTSRLYGGVVG